MGVHLPSPLRIRLQGVVEEVAPVAERHPDAPSVGPVNAVGGVEEGIAPRGNDGLVAAFRIGLPVVLDHHGHVGAVAFPAHVHDVVGPGPLVFHLVQMGLDPFHPVPALGVAHVVRRPLVGRVVPGEARIPHPEAALVVEDFAVGVGPEIVEAARRSGSQHRIGRMLLHGMEALGHAVGGAHLQHVQEEHLAARFHFEIRDRHPIEEDTPTGGFGCGQRHSQAPGARRHLLLDRVEVAQGGSRGQLVGMYVGGLFVKQRVPGQGPAFVRCAEPGSQPTRIEGVAAGRIGPEDPGDAVFVAGQLGAVELVPAVVQRLPGPVPAVEIAVENDVLRLFEDHQRSFAPPDHAVVDEAGPAPGAVRQDLGQVPVVGERSGQVGDLEIVKEPGVVAGERHVERAAGVQVHHRRPEGARQGQDLAGPTPVRRGGHPDLVRLLASVVAVVRDSAVLQARVAVRDRRRLTVGNPEPPRFVDGQIPHSRFLRRVVDPLGRRPVAAVLDLAGRAGSGNVATAVPDGVRTGALPDQVQHVFAVEDEAHRAGAAFRTGDAILGGPSRQRNGRVKVAGELGVTALGDGQKDGPAARGLAVVGGEPEPRLVPPDLPAVGVGEGNGASAAADFQVTTAGRDSASRRIENTEAKNQVRPPGISALRFPCPVAR